MKDLPHPPWAQQIQWWHPLTQQQLWKIPHSNQPFRCRKCTVESCQSLSGLILPCSPPGDTLGELECSPEQHMRSCSASGRTISHLLPPSLSIPSHLYYSGTLSSVQSHQLHQTGSGSGWYRACTSPQAARGRHFLPSVKATNTQLEILWLSSSSLEHWVLISIPGKILSGARICLNRAQTNGIHFGGTFCSHTKFCFFISFQSFQYPPFPSPGSVPSVLPKSPECPQGSSSSSTGTWAPQPQVTECSNFKIVVVTSFVGQY